MNASHARRAAAVVFASLCLAAGCRADAKPAPHAARPAAAAVEADDSAAGSVDLSGPTYTPAPLGATGSLTGVITLAGSSPATATAAATDSTCGKPAASQAAASKNGGLANTVVWIADVKTGKDFPIERRAELSSAGCAVDPRVQAVVIGTTINVFNDDDLLHRLVFTHAGSSDTLTVMRFFTTGQVVASERLAKTDGVVAIRDAYHPSTQGYIFVFDHPYFAVTDDDGSFAIDSLPPGSYRVMLWHEGLTAPVERSVQIAANGKAKLDTALTLVAAP